MAAARPSPVLALLLGATLFGGLGGAAVLGAPAAVVEVPVASHAPVGLPTPAPAAQRPAASPSPAPSPAPVRTPQPGSLEAYAAAADAICDRAFAESAPVDLEDQELADMLAVRSTSSALEVQTAQALLELPRPKVSAVSQVEDVLTAHRRAYAAVAKAVAADGRDVPARAAALVAVERATQPAATASGKVFLDLGSQRCAAWLNPAALKDTGAN